MKKRLLSLILAVIMCMSIAIPASAAQTVSPTAITQHGPSSYFNILANGGNPETQEQLLTAMFKSPKMQGLWKPILNKYVDIIAKNQGKTVYPNLDEVMYTGNGMSDALYQMTYKVAEPLKPQYDDPEAAMRYWCSLADQAFRSHPLYEKEWKDITKGPIFYTVSTTDGGNGNPIGLLFYDFHIHGIPEEFEAPEVPVGTAISDLPKHGVELKLGGSSQNFDLNAVNYDKESASITKSYEFSQSTATSTSVSTAYTNGWEEETSASVEFKIPLLTKLLGPKATVEQSFAYHHETTKTFSSTKDDAQVSTATDSVQAVLPAHTKRDVNIDVRNTEMVIPYKGNVWITFKVAMVYYQTLFHLGTTWGLFDVQIRALGRNSLCATEDLKERYSNWKSGVAGWNSDFPELEEAFKDSSFVNAVNDLTSQGPAAPYNGTFHYATRCSTATLNEPVPLYPLDRVVPNIDQLNVKVGKHQRLDSIEAQGLNQYKVPYYGFDARTDGTWELTMDRGNPGRYAKITEDQNGNPILTGLSPTNGAKLYLEFVPNNLADCTTRYYSERIAVTVGTDGPTANFKDVHSYDYFYEPVYWAVNAGITTGLNNTTFGPREECTREQVATFLWRYEGKPEPQGKNPFHDVYSGHYAYDPIVWAAEKGIAKGISPTTFCPKDEVTRAQFVTMLWRLAGQPQPKSMKSPFKDVNVNSWYGKAVLWAVENGITTGAGNGKFNPNGLCERAQVVTFLYRYNNIK